MPVFTATIRKYAVQGEKTGWTVIDIPADILKKIKPAGRSNFRIKGKLDNVPVEQLACYPIGDGNFIFALNADLRKAVGKKEGAMVRATIVRDDAPTQESQELMEAFSHEEVALAYFNSLTPSHRSYFHKWVLGAKGAGTRTGRIVSTIAAMYKKQNYGEMIRSLRK